MWIIQKILLLADAQKSELHRRLLCFFSRLLYFSLVPPLTEPIFMPLILYPRSLDLKISSVSLLSSIFSQRYSRMIRTKALPLLLCTIFYVNTFHLGVKCSHCPTLCPPSSHFVTCHPENTASLSSLWSSWGSRGLFGWVQLNDPILTVSSNIPATSYKIRTSKSHGPWRRSNQSCGHCCPRSPGPLSLWARAVLS